MEQFRLTGLTSYVNRMLQRLAAAPPEAELRELHKSIDATSRRMGISVSLKKLSAAQLTPMTRALRAWITFLSDWEDLTGYVAAIARAKTAIEPAIARQSRWRSPARIYLRPMRGMYQVKQPRGATATAELSLPTAAVCFTPDDFTAVAQMIFAADKSAKRLVLDRMQSEEFVGITAELDVLAGDVDEGRGDVYDLGDVFDRVNREYFGGLVKRPKLFWSRSLTLRKFGHYDWVGDAVMLSRTLDAPAVPRFVVDFIMFHELLHKVHGLRWSGGRGYAHTADFYRDEKRFAHYDAAESSLRKLARGNKP